MKRNKVMWHVYWEKGYKFPNKNACSVSEACCCMFSSFEPVKNASWLGLTQLLLICILDMCVWWLYKILLNILIRHTYICILSCFNVNITRKFSVDYHRNIWFPLSVSRIKILMMVRFCNSELLVTGTVCIWSSEFILMKLSKPWKDSNIAHCWWINLDPSICCFDVCGIHCIRLIYPRITVCVVCFN
jgi:hypothetical protein